MKALNRIKSLTAVEIAMVVFSVLIVGMLILFAYNAITRGITPTASI